MGRDREETYQSLVEEVRRLLDVSILNSLIIYKKILAHTFFIPPQLSHYLKSQLSNHRTLSKYSKKENRKDPVLFLCLFLLLLPSPVHCHPYRTLISPNASSNTRPGMVNGSGGSASSAGNLCGYYCFLVLHPSAKLSVVVCLCIFVIYIFYYIFLSSFYFLLI